MIRKSHQYERNWVNIANHARTFHLKDIASTDEFKARETYDQYRTALRKLAEGCNFEAVNPEEILRERLLFGIRDKVRERLSRETSLTLTKTDEICQASERTTAQIKPVEKPDGPIKFS